jgi:hypothetical protein
MCMFIFVTSDSILLSLHIMTFLVYSVIVFILCLLVVRHSNSDNGCTVMMVYGFKMYQWLNIAAKWFWFWESRG